MDGGDVPFTGSDKGVAAPGWTDSPPAPPPNRRPVSHDLMTTDPYIAHRLTEPTTHT